MNCLSIAQSLCCLLQISQSLWPSFWAKRLAIVGYLLPCEREEEGREPFGSQKTFSVPTTFFLVSRTRFFFLALSSGVEHAPPRECRVVLAQPPSKATHLSNELFVLN